MKPYNYHAEPPVSPPELSDEVWERNNRNVIRLDAIAALRTAISRLEELDYDVLSITRIEGIRLALIMEMED